MSLILITFKIKRGDEGCWSGTEESKRQQILKLNSAYVSSQILCVIDTVDWLPQHPFHFFFFSLAFLHFGNAEAKSLFFSDSVFTIDDPVTPFWPVSHKYWSLSVLPLLFPPSCCLEHRSHPRTVSVVSKDDRTEKQASCFLVALLSSYTPPRPSCLPTYDLLLHKSFAI